MKARSQVYFQRIAHWAGFLCLLHCLASVLLAAFAPTLLKVLPHNFWMEASAWGLVNLSAYFTLKRAGAGRWLWSMWALLAFTGFYFVIFHDDSIFLICWLLLALFQLTVTFKHHWSGKHVGEDLCCTHCDHPEEEAST